MSGSEKEENVLAVGISHAMFLKVVNNNNLNEVSKYWVQP